MYAMYAPKMYANQLNNICNGDQFFVCSFTENILLCQYFSRLLLRFVLQLSIKDFQNFTNFCFPENLLVAATNRFKVLKIFISLKVTVCIQDRRLRFEKAWKRVSNGNLVVLKCQNIHVILYIYIETWSSSLLYIQQRCIQNPSQRLNKELIPLEVTIFTKISILHVWKGSEYAVAQ